MKTRPAMRTEKHDNQNEGWNTNIFFWEQNPESKTKKA